MSIYWMRAQLWQRSLQINELSVASKGVPTFILLFVIRLTSGWDLIALLF